VLVARRPRRIGRASQLERDWAYLLGRRITLFRVEHLLLWPPLTTSVSDVNVLLTAALRLVNPGISAAPGMERMVAERTAMLRDFLPPQSIATLGAVVDRLQQSATPLDVREWMRGVDHTASRAGLLLCDDLATAAGYALAEPSLADNDPQAKVRDLIGWSVSYGHAELRRVLGLAIAEPRVRRFSDG
jgi:golgin subfamily B member 1